MFCGFRGVLGFLTGIRAVRGDSWREVVEMPECCILACFFFLFDRLMAGWRWWMWMLILLFVGRKKGRKKERKKERKKGGCWLDVGYILSCSRVLLSDVVF